MIGGRRKTPSMAIKLEDAIPIADIDHAVIILRDRPVLGMC